MIRRWRRQPAMTASKYGLISYVLGWRKLLQNFEEVTWASERQQFKNSLHLFAYCLEIFV
jgi:hypothetical protein